MAVFLMGAAGTALAQNSPPVTEAGENQTIYFGDVAALHGTATDPDGDPIVAWKWEVISAPAGSVHSNYMNTPDATFMTDTLGNYLITLIASDFYAWGDPDVMLVSVVENQPPTAVATASPLSGQAPLTVSFDGTGSSDPEGGDLSYYWIFGDGQMGSGATLDHEFQLPGIYSVGLIVTDEGGADDFDIIEITVCGDGINCPPVADAGEDVNIFFGESVDLHGTATDSNGDPIIDPTWSWMIDAKPEGSTPYLSNPTGQNPYFVPDMAGDYVLSLVVNDGIYESLPDSITVYVAMNLPPVVIATADPITGSVPLTVNFDGSQSFDPEGGPLDFDWSFRDGSRSTEVAPIHVFGSEGSFLVRLEVEDNMNQATVETLLITVCGDGINCPPVADAGPYQTIYLGDSVTLHGTATDPDGDPIMGWQWEVISAPTGSTYNLSDKNTSDALFTADTLGDYVITLIAQDYYAWGDPDATLVAVVENQPPTAVAAASPLSGPAPLLVSFDGTGSSDPEGGDLWYDWIFGDGQTGSGATLPHEFQSPGIYSVALVVTDDGGADDFDIIDITVTPGGNIKVSPAEYDFGDVELGSSSSTIITIMNPLGGTYEDPVYIENISLMGGGSGSFEVTVNPAGSTIQPGESNDVGITFTPSAEGYVSTTLQIASDDPVFPLIEVALGGEGVLDELPPEGQIAAILGFFDAAVEAGSLEGDGPGNSAGNRLNAQRNMIEACGDLIEDELYEDACGQLAAALKKCDGQPNPPDFVTGEAAAVIKSMIEVLRATLGCPI